MTNLEGNPGEYTNNFSANYKQEIMVGLEIVCRIEGV